MSEKEQRDKESKTDKLIFQIPDTPENIARAVLSTPPKPRAKTLSSKRKKERKRRS